MYRNLQQGSRKTGNSSAFRLPCYKCMHTGCDFRSLAPANLGITLRMQRGLHSVSVGAYRVPLAHSGLHSVSVGAYRVPLAHSALAGHWKAELLRRRNRCRFLI